MNVSSASLRSVLVVEDDKAIRDLVVFHLELAKFDVTAIADGSQAQSLIAERKFDLIILDLRLPGRDGIALCRTIRGDGLNSKAPILILTARREETDKVLGLKSGADDYLTKPFGIRELMARVEALMRRSGGTWRAAPPSRELPVVSLMGVTIDPQKHRVECDGEVVSLTPQEFNLLYLLASHPGVVFDREELLARVRDGDVNITNRGVDTLVRRLRIKIEKDPTNPQRIITVWGSGYKFGEV
ncbi:MAG TPA: response regulator transcription factor [Steroidobacteraceae bacterium]|nr:response regulator transcription factor [Steroidobacteraceae bacterium]